MDITNDTSQPVIVEAERGGGGGPADPPFRTKFKSRGKADDVVDSKTLGGAARLRSKTNTASFPKLKAPKVNVRLFKMGDGYGGCPLEEFEVAGNNTYFIRYKNGKWVLEV